MVHDFDAIFAALAHGDRRRMLELLVQAPGLSVKALSSHFACSRVMVLKHLRVLAAAELVISERAGRERRLYFNPMPVRLIYDRWTDQYSASWAAGPDEVKKTRVGSQSGDREQKPARDGRGSDGRADDSSSSAS
ncbi:MAG: ArsR family transcriptional regulator [Phycisphaerales bacterium]|nr:ArsR family transcriptional regulator [Phycisphaerales bacterium]